MSKQATSLTYISLDLRKTYSSLVKIILMERIILWK